MNTNQAKHFAKCITKEIDYTAGSQKYINIMTRTSGDEREKRSGYSGKWDERNRYYHRIKINKQKLYKLWRDAKGKNQEEIISVGGANGHIAGKEDKFGDAKGYSHHRTNHDNPLWLMRKLEVKISGPKFHVTASNFTKKDGGLYANWVDATEQGWHCIDYRYPSSHDTKPEERLGLHPRYAMDFQAWNGSFYSSDTDGITDGGYFKGDRIKPYRPISFVSSSNSNVDVQNYYDASEKNSQILLLQSSVPTTIDLSFRLSNSDTSTNIDYIITDGEGSDTDYRNEFKYWFFVIDWDYENSGNQLDTLEQVESIFPNGTFEYEQYLFKNLFDLKRISSDPQLAQIATSPNYLDSGIKIIKAIVFRTVDCHWTDDDANDTLDFSTYKQAVDWKLVTTKIYLDEGGNVFTDFHDIGGDEFIYLPYPNINYLQAEADTSIYDLFFGGEDSIPDGFNQTIHGRPESDITRGSYKSSHVVISGLSKDSSYINSLIVINQLQPFSRSDVDEKAAFQKAYKVSPIGQQNEYGSFLGNSDIAQIRYFNKGTMIDVNSNSRPLDMYFLLGIDALEETAEVDIFQLKSYDGGDWNCQDWASSREHCFEESPLDSLFISEYDQFRKECIIEINCSELDSKSFRDTNGNGNKGVLIGDFSVKKDNIDEKTSRDSYVRIPKLSSANGAI